MLTTFGLTVFVDFFIENIGHALSYIAGIISEDIFSIPAFSGEKIH